MLHGDVETAIYCRYGSERERDVGFLGVFYFCMDTISWDIEMAHPIQQQGYVQPDFDV
jgi:hypothetical protein